MVKRINIDSPNVVNSAVNILEGGGIIVYPTDTLYGFGADATNEYAIDKLNRIKGRVGPMSVLAENINTAINWMDINTEQTTLVKQYLERAQTLIVTVKPNTVSSKILGEDNTLGIRIPDNVFCNELSHLFDKPIISTSINRSCKQAMNDPNQIESEFGSEIDLLIDAGTLPYSKGSTIYMLKDNNITILRK